MNIHILISINKHKIHSTSKNVELSQFRKSLYSKAIWFQKKNFLLKQNTNITCITINKSFSSFGELATARNGNKRKFPLYTISLSIEALKYFSMSNKFINYHIWKIKKIKNPYFKIIIGKLNMLGMFKYLQCH